MSSSRPFPYARLLRFSREDLLLNLKRRVLSTTLMGLLDEVRREGARTTEGSSWTAGKFSLGDPALSSDLPLTRERSGGYCATLQEPGGRFLLIRLDAVLVALLSSAVLNIALDRVLSRPLSALETGLVDRALLNAISALSLEDKGALVLAQSGHSLALSLRAFRRSEALWWARLPISVQKEGGLYRGSIEVLCPDRGEGRWPWKVSPALEVITGLPWRSASSITFQVLLGALLLSPSQCRSLSIKDVLFPIHSWTIADSSTNNLHLSPAFCRPLGSKKSWVPLAVEAEGERWQIRLWDKNLEPNRSSLSYESLNISLPKSPFEDPMKEKVILASKVLADVLKSAPVEVSFELARLSFTAEQLERFAAGDLIDLGRTLGAPIQIFAGGVLVAEGGLVEVEGHYGVQLLRRVE